MQDQNVNESTDMSNSRILREAIKASSNLLASNDPMQSAKLAGALSLLAIASNMKESRYNIRLLNAATNIIQKSL